MPKPDMLLSDLTIRKEIRFVGLRRSGNHALINWMLRQAGGNTLFFNDVDPDRPFDLSRLARHTRMPDNKICDCLVYGYEDRLLEVVGNVGCYPQRGAEDYKVEQRLDVIVLRDPFNSFASRMKHSEVPTGVSTYISGLSVPQLWTAYAREFLDKTHRLTQKKIGVNYNLWCKSSEYRSQIARLLEIDFSDKGFNDVTAFGQGSSFDSLRFSGDASTMTTEARWKTVAEDSNYIELFRDRLLLDLAEKIFDLGDELLDFVETKLRPKTRLQAAATRKIATAILPPMIAGARNSMLFRHLYFTYLQPLRRSLVSKKTKTRLQ